MILTIRTAFCEREREKKGERYFCRWSVKNGKNGDRYHETSAEFLKKKKIKEENYAQ